MDALSPTAALSQQNLMDSFDRIHAACRNMCLSTATLVVGTGSAAMVRISTTATYLSNGVFKSKTAAEVAFTAVTHDIAANALTVQEAIYLVCLAANGDPSLHMGAISAGAGTAVLPDVPADLTPIGYVRVAVAAGATPFEASVDLLSAGHLTDTYVNLGFVAPRFDAAQ